jgi:6-phosphogluconolactonase
MLTPSDPPVVDTKAGAGPRHFTIHPTASGVISYRDYAATIGAYDRQGQGD